MPTNSLQDDLDTITTACGNERDDILKARLRVRLKGLKLTGRWTIEGLNEYISGLHYTAIAVACLDLQVDLTPELTLWDITRYTAQQHALLFPTGDHRYFEHATLDKPNRTITFSMGS